MISSKSLDVATETYYWKPYAAFARTIELNAYIQSNAEFSEPFLDLGCGDGGIAEMLLKLGLAQGNPVGIDISHTELKKAAVKSKHKGLANASANFLPFRDEQFSSIVCNGVLCSIPEGVDLALNEIHRVLKPGGNIVVTVPTDHFVEILLFPKLLGMFSAKLQQRYINKLNGRLPHFNAYSIELWKEKFSDNNLSVLNTELYFNNFQGTVWNILTMHLLRMFSVLKLVKIKFIQSLVKAILFKIFGFLLSKKNDADKPRGYMLIVAQKSGV